MPALLALKENAQHPPQRFGCTPKELVPDGKGGQMRARALEGELAKTPDGDPQGAAYGSRGELAQRRFALVRHDPHPVVRLREHLLKAL